MNKNICPVCGRVGVCWINYSTAEEYYRCSKCPNRWYPEKKVKRTGIMRLQEKIKGLEERLLVSKGFIQMIADCGGFGSAAAKDVLLKIEGGKEMSNCCARVWSGFHSQGCSRPGSIERDGKFYCKQHDPQAVKEREQKTRKRQQLEFDKKWDKYLLGNRAADSYEKHCKVPLEAVEGDFLTKVLGLLFEAVPFVPAGYDEECGEGSCDCRTCRFRVLDFEERWFCESFDKTLEKLEIFCTRFEKKEEE